MAYQRASDIGGGARQGLSGKMSQSPVVRNTRQATPIQAPSRPVSSTPPSSVGVGGSYQATPIRAPLQGGGASSRNTPAVSKGAPVNNQSRAQRSNGRVSASPNRGRSTNRSNSFGMAGASASQARAAQKKKG